MYTPFRKCIVCNAHTRTKQRKLGDAYVAWHHTGCIVLFCMYTIKGMSLGKGVYVTRIPDGLRVLHNTIRPQYTGHTPVGG